MKSALRVTEPGPNGGFGSRKTAAQAVPASIPLAKRSRLGAKIAAGEFVTMVEIVPPKGTDIKKKSRARSS